MKGKLPETHFIFLEKSDEGQWRLLVRGLVNELRISALVEKEPGYQVRIQIVINEIYSPEQLKNKTTCHTDTNLNKNIANGISRIGEFFNDYLGKTTWLFAGYIDGEEKVPIVVYHYQVINMSVYTQKLKGEDIKNFLPYPQQN